MDFFEFAESIERYTPEDFLDDVQVAAENSPYIKALQLQQWNEGENNEGGVLGRYSLATEIISDGKKKKGETFDINDTGETRRKTELFAEQQNGDLNLYFDGKSKAIADGLLERAPKLFGLKPRNITLASEIVQDLSVNILNEKLKLK